MSQETTTTQVQEAEQAPIFEEATTIDENSALSVLIQAANLAQAAGRLSVRDSVLLAKSIETLRPGTV